jgi:hypothetical protein
MLSSSLFSDAKPSEPGTIAILWITVESYDTDTSSAFIEEIILKAGILIQRFLEISSSAFPGKEFLLDLNRKFDIILCNPFQSHTAVPMFNYPSLS